MENSILQLGLHADAPTNHAHAGQIYFDVFYARFGSGTGGIIALGIPLIGNYCAGCTSVASNSR